MRVSSLRSQLGDVPSFPDAVGDFSSTKAGIEGVNKATTATSEQAVSESHGAREQPSVTIAELRQRWGFPPVKNKAFK